MSKIHNLILCTVIFFFAIALMDCGRIGILDTCLNNFDWVTLLREVMMKVLVHLIVETLKEGIRLLAWFG